MSVQPMRPFGSSGPQVPVVGQGTWNMEADDRRSAVEALVRGMDLGMTHIDTAEMYGDGAVEKLVASAIEERRREVFLVSKVLPYNASRKKTVKACERSLGRLKTDSLDCYLLHWPGDHPLEDTLEAFEELRDAGKIRMYGVSNFDDEELEEAVRLAGPGRIACNQVLYHLGERSIEHRILPACQRHGVAVVAYSPFGSGRFPSPRSAGGRVLAEIAERHGASAHQVALAFLTRHPSVLAIPKASRVDHAEDNAGATRLVLTPEDIGRIDEAFPLGRPTGGAPML